LRPSGLHPHKDELTFYSYKVDKLTDEVLPVLADKNNNVIDALRYALWKTSAAPGLARMDFASTGERATVAAAGATAEGLLEEQIEGSAHARRRPGSDRLGQPPQHPRGGVILMGAPPPSLPRPASDQRRSRSLTSLRRSAGGPAGRR
jgi:hypothetical protein